MELPGPSVSSQSLEEKWNERQREAQTADLSHVLQALDKEHILCYYLDG